MLLTVLKEVGFTPPLIQIPRVYTGVYWVLNRLQPRSREMVGLVMKQRGLDIFGSYGLTDLNESLTPPTSKTIWNNISTPHMDSVRLGVQ